MRSFDFGSLSNPVVRLEGEVKLRGAARRPAAACVRAVSVANPTLDGTLKKHQFMHSDGAEACVCSVCDGILGQTDTLEKHQLIHVLGLYL